MHLGFVDHVFPDGPFLGLWWCFGCGCAADMDTVTDGGLLALAGAGVGPGLEHLEFCGESPDFHFNPWCFSFVVFTSPPRFGADGSFDFHVYLFASNWVGCYQVGDLPEGVFSAGCARVC